MDEISLIKRCQQGDLDAFEILVEHYTAKAIRTAYLITGRRDIAEDIAQEAFVQCYRQIQSLRDPKTFPAWFYRILSRLSWRHASKEKGVLSLESLSDQDQRTLLSDDNVSSAMETKQKQELLHEALSRLSVPLRTTTILYYFNELSVKEIARVLGCREGTVKSRLHNARKRLAVELQRNDYTLSLTEKECRDEKNAKQQIKECETNAV